LFVVFLVPLVLVLLAVGLWLKRWLMSGLAQRKQLPNRWPELAALRTLVETPDMKAVVQDLVQQQRNTTAVSAIAGHLEKSDTHSRPMAHGMPAADTNREVNAMNPDTERELATLRAEVVLLRSQMESATILLATGTKLLNGLQDHRDALLKAIRWHRDQIQAPGRPDKKLWRITVDHWDKLNGGT
jgi:hypothetical protein